MKRLELSIEGEGKDGQVLVVDQWPNFKTMDMPKVQVAGKSHPVYRDLGGESYRPGMPEAIGLLLIILWLTVLTVAMVTLTSRVYDENPKA